MRKALITGSGGLIGSECVRHFAESGYRVIGIDNDMRAEFFGPEASTATTTRHLIETYDDFECHEIDIRDRQGIDKVFARARGRLDLIIHTAAQPSHDWAASNPHVDFAVNATGTLNLLEAARSYCPDATFIFTSTNKVYGDLPNQLPLIDAGQRLELPDSERYHQGIDTTMSIDRSMHSLFGASKAAADLLVQEYGRYFDMPTVCFRGGCLTGPAHAGARLHGFLSYLMKCTVSGEPYTVYGYDGKQVRDNIHSKDLVSAFEAFHRSPRTAAVYNIGGGREVNCSMLEAIALCEQVAGAPLAWELEEHSRMGDHRWWISDLNEFRRDYPEWRLEYQLEVILGEIYDANAERWAALH